MLDKLNDPIHKFLVMNFYLDYRYIFDYLWRMEPSSLADIMLFCLVLSVVLAGRLWRRDGWRPSLRFFVVGYLVCLGATVFSIVTAILLTGGTFEWNKGVAAVIFCYHNHCSFLIELGGLALILWGAFPLRGREKC